MTTYISKLTDIHRKYCKYLLLAFVWSIVYATHAFLGYYHDDYAYAGLTYFYEINGIYTERLTIVNYFNYLYQHYMGWGGRIVAIGIAIPFMHMGPDLFWFVQSILITGIIYLSSAIANSFTKNSNYIQTIIFITSCYMSLKIYIVRDGLYWASASILYTWPFFFFLLAIHLRHLNNNNTYKKILILICFFISAASSEPFSLLTTTYLCAKLFIEAISKQKTLVNSTLDFTVSVFGSLFCLIAPGNLKRASIIPGQSIPSIQELINNIPDSILWFLKRNENFDLTIIIFCVWLASIFIFRLHKPKEIQWKLMLPLFIGCCATVSIFVLPAAKFSRVLMPILFLLPILATPLFCSFLNKLPGKMLPTLCLFLVFAYGANNYLTIFKGYKNNYSTLQHNDKVLSAYPQGCDIVILKKLPNDIFAHQMPYQVGREYISDFMKSYYDIPKQVKFIFVGPD